ncbi:Uncharacterised protein [Dermatophilus congolensis]|uniref:Uncharacterized protein n=2 Tax=Dermatophilus congolensis TaxID=1863 RepID=A0AA46H115_9MICO|nr:Uncharacterised protein [Dermatophilus congolensis]
MKRMTRRFLAAGAAAAVVASVAVPASAADTAPKRDLAVSYAVSGAKIPGYPGLVTLRLTNAGTDRYYGEFPLVTFEVKIITAKGPQGVNRNIGTRSFHGSHVEDLGFDEATSTHTYRVILSNPVERGTKGMNIAGFYFGIGATREGRVIQKIVTTQKGRLPGDTPNANDQNVDSTVAGNTHTNFGKPTGLF